jgi:hypothetical protein
MNLRRFDLIGLMRLWRIRDLLSAGPLGMLRPETLKTPLGAGRRDRATGPLMQLSSSGRAHL